MVYSLSGTLSSCPRGQPQTSTQATLHHHQPQQHLWCIKCTRDPHPLDWHLSTRLGDDDDDDDYDGMSPSNGWVLFNTTHHPQCWWTWGWWHWTRAAASLDTRTWAAFVLQRTHFAYYIVGTQEWWFIFQVQNFCDIYYANNYCYSRQNVTTALERVFCWFKTDNNNIILILLLPHLK